VKSVVQKSVACDFARAKLEKFFNPATKLARFRLTIPIPMNSIRAKIEPSPCKPISIGLSCWLWQRRAPRLVQLSQRLGVTLQLTEQTHGLRREIQCQVSGQNVDRFIGEFVRHC
jgi:hypothetical protein